MTYELCVEQRCIIIFGRSTHDCTFGTTEGLLMFSDCYERHSFNPFDASKTGATTEQRRKLTFISDYEDEANSRNFYGAFIGELL